MSSAVNEVLHEIKWRKRQILRGRRFFSCAKLVQHWKSRILSYVEYRTGAIYHAANSVLEPLNRMQDSFLQELGISPEEALADFNLAPWATRRDIASLGMIHRTVLGLGPSHFGELFYLSGQAPANGLYLRHSWQLHEYGSREDQHPLNWIFGNASVEAQCFVRRSALGLVTVYNALPHDTVMHAPSVQVFQSKLQDMVKAAASHGTAEWRLLFSPRCELRPLKRLVESF